jgi:hypothetical protein
MSNPQPTKLWVLEPAVAPADPRWQDRVIWRKVVVAAPRPAAARHAAEQWALAGRLDGPGNESSAAIAGFRDELLFSVRPLRPEDGIRETSAAEGQVVFTDPPAPESLGKES